MGKGGYQGVEFYVMKRGGYGLFHMGNAYTGVEAGFWALVGGRESGYIMILGWKLCFYMI